MLNSKYPPHYNDLQSSINLSELTKIKHLCSRLKWLTPQEQQLLKATLMFACLIWQSIEKATPITLIIKK